MYTVNSAKDEFVNVAVMPLYYKICQTEAPFCHGVFWQLSAVPIANVSSIGKYIKSGCLV
jgi:hypothetical protein